MTETEKKEEVVPGQDENGKPFNNNQYAYLYNNELKDNDENLLNNNGPNSLPERQMVCWNCLSILTVKPTWGIVQCPNCDKFNRVPDCDQGEKTKLKLDKNNFEIASPYVYVVMTCPFCKEDNKVKKETEHVVCYNCLNSFSIENPTIKCISSKKPVTIHNKVTRVSDINFPDPMFFRGYYPQPNPVYQVPCSDHHEVIEDISREIANFRGKQKNRSVNPYDRYDKYEPLRKMIRDVHEIEFNRNVDMNLNEKLKNQIHSKNNNLSSQITYESNPYNLYWKKNNNNNINVIKGGINNSENNKKVLSSNDNFYRRIPTPSFFKQNKNSVINKMLFTSWNNN